MLIKKMLRDVGNNRIQFLAIFIMAVLGTLIYAGLNCEWFTMEKQADAFYKKTNMSDFWVYGKTLDEKDLDSIKGINGVKTVEGRFKINANNKTINNNSELQLNFVTTGEISKVVTKKGEEFSHDKKGIWIDYEYAIANNIKIGEDIDLSFMGIDLSEEVCGFIISPEYIYNVKDDSEMIPNHEKFGYAFLSYDILKEKGITTYNTILVKNNTKDWKSIEGELNKYYITIFNSVNFPSIFTLNNEISQHRSLGNIFPVIFLAIAILSILTTMTRLTKNQRIQIGTLMSLGFKKRKILRHYISYGFLISLFGGILGMIIGQLFIPNILFKIQKPVYTLPDWTIKVPYFNFIMLIVIVFSCTVTNYLACRKELKDVPAETLRMAPPKAGNHNVFENTALWKKMSFNFQWNIRDIWRNKVRTLMAILGCMGCMALLLCAFGMNDTIDHVGTWMYKDLYKFQNKVAFKIDADINDIERLRSELNGQLIQEENIELQYNHSKKNGLLTVDTGSGLIQYEDTDGNSINLPENGVAISNKMASLLGVDNGDTIRWRIIGEELWFEAKVASVYQMPIGQGICVSKTAYERLGDFKPNGMLVGDINHDKVMGETFVDSIKSKSDFINAFDTMLDTMRMIVALLIIFAVLLGVIVLYNLGILYYTERFREFATLKVLGFKSRRIKTLMIAQNIWLTIIGVLLGLPAGFLLLNYMTGTLGENLDMRAVVFLTSILICIAGTLFVSLFVNILLARNIKKIDMVSALKSVE